MRILIRTVFFTSLAILSNCLDPNALSEVLQRHEHLQPISHGIYYYSIDIDDFKKITPEKFNQLQRRVNGFIIGISSVGYLLPIYDINHVPVIARPNNMGTTDNTPLTQAEMRVIPYYDTEPVSYICSQPHQDNM